MSTRATIACWARMHRVRQAARRRGLLAVTLVSVGLALGCAPLGLAHAASASGSCATNGDRVTCTYTYTGAAQTWTAPTGVSAATFDVFGAVGGFDCNGGGLGGEAQATIAVTAGATLQITVGGSGTYKGSGFNGGGAPGADAPNGTGGGGGGASDVRTSPFALADRIIVAGGGGGGMCASGDGGNGGGLTGASGSSRQGGNGAGGSQSTGGAGGAGGGFSGSLGLGGNGGPGDGDIGGGGGGGGGYYGGGGGGGDAIQFLEGAGGGGSSYVTPAALTSTLIQGDNAGDGRITITYAAPVAPTITQLASASNPSTYGQPLTLTATVTGGPGITLTGTVTFTDGTTTLGTAMLDSSGTATFSTSSLGAGSHSITAVYGGDAADLSSASTALGQQVAPAPLTITADNQSMTYGGAPPAFDARYSGFVNGDTAASLSAAPTCSSVVASSSAGSYPITCSGASAANYAISYITGTLTINAAPLTITASSPSVVYNGSVPAITPSYSGFVNGDSAASLTTAPTCTSTAPSNGAVGTYTTSCSGAADPNYSIGYQAGTLTIAPAAQTISFGSLAAHTLGEAPFTVSATGGASGNPVTFSAGPSSVCTSGGTNGATITLVGVGTCTVTANQAGNANYLAAPSVSQSFSVAYPPLSLALGLSSSPAGPITTGSTVTATLTLGNHTAQAQTVCLRVTLAYRGSHSYVSITFPLRLRLAAGQTLNKSVSIPIYAWSLRGTYTVSATATDGSGDTARSSASLTVS